MVLRPWAGDSVGADRPRLAAGRDRRPRWTAPSSRSDALDLLAFRQGVAQAREPAGLDRFQAGAFQVFGEIALRIARQQIAGGIGDDDLGRRPCDAAVGVVEPPQLAGRGVQFPIVRRQRHVILDDRCEGDVRPAGEMQHCPFGRETERLGNSSRPKTRRHQPSMAADACRTRSSRKSWSALPVMPSSRFAMATVVSPRRAAGAVTTRIDMEPVPLARAATLRPGGGRLGRRPPPVRTSPSGVA